MSHNRSKWRRIAARADAPFRRNLVLRLRGRSSLASSSMSTLPSRSSALYMYLMLRLRTRRFGADARLIFRPRGRTTRSCLQFLRRPAARAPSACARRSVSCSSKSPRGFRSEAADACAPAPTDDGCGAGSLLRLPPVRAVTLLRCIRFVLLGLHRACAFTSASVVLMSLRFTILPPNV